MDSNRTTQFFFSEMLIETKYQVKKWKIEHLNTIGTCKIEDVSAINI